MKDTVLRFKVESSLKEQLVQAARVAGADDFSEWARRVLAKESAKVLERAARTAVVNEARP